MHICFDIDGTVCENSPEMNHDDPMSILQHTRPKHAALVRLVKALAAGHTVSFVTARSEKVQGATMKQLKTWLPSIAGIEICHRDFEPYEMMAAVCYKLDRLRYLEPDLYVGDLPMDQTSAAAAGVPFMPAEWWAKGIPIEHVTSPDMKPLAIQLRARELEYIDAEENYRVRLAYPEQMIVKTRFGLPIGLAGNPGDVAGVQEPKPAASVGEVEVAARSDAGGSA